MHHMNRQLMSIYPIGSDANLDHLGKVVSASFLYHKATISPFFVIK